MNARAVIIALAVVAVGAAIMMSGGGNKSKGKGDLGSTPSTGKAPSGSLKITFAYSPEKEVLALPLIKQFNSEHVKVDGRPVFVEAQNVSSGDAETKIAQGQLKPTAWSPASSLWGRLLNYEADKGYIAQDNPSLARTPLVIAMWEPLARALGWPKKPVGFGEVLKLATSRTGWADYGHPEYGRFKLGHTNPDFSTSGLSAVAAEYFAATGKREGLTQKDIADPAVRRRIKTIEQSIVHYGDTTLFFSDQLKAHGPAYASAVAMEEATLVAFNKGRRGTKLVGIYPREGTFFSDNPFLILNAPWVSAAQKQAAQKLADYLEQKITPARALAAGFRPGDPNVKPTAPIDAAHGADPNEPRTTLGLPEPKVLAAVKRAWRADRKAANVMLVFDTSGSMGEESKIDQAKDGLRVFFRELSPRDRVGLSSFNTKVFMEAAIAPVATNLPLLKRRVSGLLPDGETAVFDATSKAYDAVRALRDDTRINAVVVLTDGEDNQSQLTARELVAKLSAQNQSEQQVVRVFTIAYGSGANRSTLAEIAKASGGEEFAGDPTQIEAVYRTISSFF
ncbi:MAG: Ca-activated chloride channel [Thermoleophilaceae bacterium]|nr:Ca-activated chloride channel [Thermoleophilaceae bacterium]